MDPLVPPCTSPRGTGFGRGWTLQTTLTGPTVGPSELRVELRHIRAQWMAPVCSGAVPKRCQNLT